MADEKRLLRSIHGLFLGKDLTPLQQRLYDAFPRVRGFSSQEKIREHLEAVAVLGIAQTWQIEGDDDPHTVFFFVPSPLEMVWCLEVLKGMAKSVFTMLKEKPTERDAKLRGAKMIGDLFNHLHIGVLGNTATPPERWVAFGFRNSDATLPEWLRKSLLAP